MDGCTLPQPPAELYRPHGGRRRWRFKAVRVVTGALVRASFGVVSELQRNYNRDPVAELERTAQRARTAVKDKAIALQADHLVTLSYRRNEDDLRASQQHVSEFIQCVRRILPEWKAVCVAERQKRGAVHWHIAVHGYQHINLLAKFWCRIIGEERAGQVNVKRFKSRSPESIGVYIAKYIGKGFENEDRPRYGHHYKTSRGIPVSITRHYLDGGTTLDAMDWCGGLVLATGAEWRGSWQGHAPPDYGSRGGAKGELK